MVDFQGETEQTLIFKITPPQYKDYWLSAVYFKAVTGIFCGGMQEADKRDGRQLKKTKQTYLKSHEKQLNYQEHLEKSVIY